MEKFKGIELISLSDIVRVGYSIKRLKGKLLLVRDEYGGQRKVGKKELVTSVGAKVRS